MTKYEKALLDVIAYAEGTLGTSNNGYDVTFGHWVINGWTENTDITHQGGDWAQPFGSKTSDAAGRYQFLQSTWKGSWLGGTNTKKGQNVAMTKDNQDIAALYQVKNKVSISVTDDELNGMENFNTFKTVLDKMASECASLPTLDGTGYYSSQGGKYGHTELHDVFLTALALY